MGERSFRSRHLLRGGPTSGAGAAFQWLQIVMLNGGFLCRQIRWSVHVSRGEAGAAWLDDVG